MDIKMMRRLVPLIMVAIAVTGCGKSDPNAGGAVWGSEVDRTLQLPTHDVYRAFSEPLSSGLVATTDQGPEGITGPITSRVKKKLDTSITMVIETPSDRLVSIRLQFDPLAHGTATRVRGDIDINPSPFAKVQDVPHGAHKQFQDALNAAIDEVAAGKPPQSMRDLGMYGSQVGQSPFQYGDARPAESRVVPPMMSGGTVVPMQSGEPMLDPNAVAREHTFSGNH